MRVARVFFPVTVLGPGRRIGIWVAGCERHCPGCANPELWESVPRQEITPEHLYEAVEAHLVPGQQVDGVTISGGEPFAQAEELLALVRRLKRITEDILIFSGYTREELLADETKAAVLEEISVLVDGAYIEAQNRAEVLRGSQNQRFYYRDDAVRAKYEAYLHMAGTRPQVQTFRVRDGVVAVGIHRNNFRHELSQVMHRKQFTESDTGGEHR